MRAAEKYDAGVVFGEAEAVTGVINQIRAFLLERGVAVRQGLRFLRAGLPQILATRTDVLSPRMVVSPDVFQAIWSARQAGQDTEDAILRGIFKLAPARDIHVTVGFHDPRYGVKLDPGFTISRDYKGKHYTATAVQGFWISSADQKGYPTLNELNKSIGVAGPENAWAAWHYHDDSGRRRPLSDLRDRNTIKRRRC